MKGDVNFNVGKLEAIVKLVAIRISSALNVYIEIAI